MQEVGWVKAIENGVATVVLPRREECHRCGACKLGVSTDENLEIQARNDAGANVGNRVTIEVGTNVLTVSFVVYAVPLLLMFAAYFAGEWLASIVGGAAAAQLGGVIAAFLGVVLGFYFVAAYDRRLRQSSARGPRVVSVVK